MHRESELNASDEPRRRLATEIPTFARQATDRHGQWYGEQGVLLRHQQDFRRHACVHIRSSN